MPHPLPIRTVLLVVAGVAAIGGTFVLLASKGREAPGKIPIVQPATSAQTPHVAGDENLTLENVVLDVTYFVPRDRQEFMLAEWRGSVEKAAEQVRAFHRLQFRDVSRLSYRIREKPVIGERDGFVYDSSDTNRGNPNAWETIREELRRRLGSPEQAGETFTVRFVLYEGVGALGGVDQILISSGYLRTDYAASVVYHELGHTFGLKDAYTYDHGTPTDEDIMGLGRNRPIGQTYLSENAKRELGVL